MKIFVMVFLTVMFASSAWAYPVTAPAGKTLKVHWAVLQAKPGKMQEMAAISARTVAKYTPNEKGSYSLYGAIDSTNHDLMRILEIYEDEDAYQVHRDSDGFKAFIEERKPILESLKILPVDPVVLEQKAEGKGRTVSMALVEVKPECLEEFKALTIQEFTRAVNEDDGVMGLFATSEQGDRNNFVHTLEIFADDEAREKYFASENFRAFNEKAAGFVNSIKIFTNMPANITLSKKGLHTISSEQSESFVFVKGGKFLMGSPESENWRSSDEAQHEVTLNDFWIARNEVTQSEYQALMNDNPSTFHGDNLPVENVTWLEAVKFCNEKSKAENLTPAYVIEGSKVTWNLSADGYRLPTEAEWEFACRAGTATPFNLEHSIGADEANFYGHYPYEIEENYFSQHKLTTKPGIYRGETVNVGSFAPNKLGLFDMHGNVGEWCWDIYAPYPSGKATNPTGPESGTRRVNRGGGWNDFAKNMRSAYRAAAPQERRLYNVGFRLARGAIGTELIASQAVQEHSGKNGKVLIAFFTWSGNTQGIAYEIQKQTGAEIFEITPEKAYSESYNTVLREAQRDQHRQARPKLSRHIKNFDDYDVIMLGYPNWWASIPMPIASFLEEYDFSGKTIMPFCSHGGGRFGQSLTAIAKLAPKANITEGLSVHYSGGGRLKEDIAKWLAAKR